MTPHFQADEVKCKCGCGMLPRLAFMEKVEALRIKLGRPARVSSGARCPEYNAKVSHTGRTGPHTTGRAIDLLVSGLVAYELLELATSCGFTGIGISQKGDHLQRFIHLDDLTNEPGQPRPWVWSY